MVRSILEFIMRIVPGAWPRGGGGVPQRSVGALPEKSLQSDSEIDRKSPRIFQRSREVRVA